ncbi:hypothetical protein D3C86_1369970 [compost metagenome]
MLLAHRLLYLFPLHAKRRIREHVVELAVAMAIVRQRVTGDDIFDRLALDEHVRLADSVGLVVELLAIHGEPRLGIVLQQIFSSHREHAASASRRVVNRADHSLTGTEYVVILDEQQVHHQADDFAWCEMFPRCLIRNFGEFSDELFEHQAHVGVVHRLRVQVDIRELFGDEVKQIRLRETLNLGVKVESLENVPRCWGEGLHVSVEVLSNVVLVAK